MAVTNHFRFTIPGQPPSWNASYRMRKARIRDKFGQPVLGPDLKPKTVTRMFKTQDVVDYQNGVQMLTRAARPTGFAPKDQVIIGYQFYLGKSIDCDNVMKAVNDAVAKALGINDARFWPVTLHRQTGVPDPRVVIYVFDGTFWFPTICANDERAAIFDA